MILKPFVELWTYIKVLQILSECLTAQMTFGSNVTVRSRLGNETRGLGAAMKVA